MKEMRVLVVKIIITIMLIIIATVISIKIIIVAVIVILIMITTAIIIPISVVVIIITAHLDRNNLIMLIKRLVVNTETEMQILTETVIILEIKMEI